MTNDEDRLVGLVLIVVSVLVLVGGQSLMKSALNAYGPIPLKLGAGTLYFVKLLASWKFLLAASGILASALLWYAGLSRTPLSVAYPLTALSYPLILASAAIFLGEGLSVPLVLGNALIVLGVLTVGYSSSG